jgi:hypothetical protein
MGDPTLRMNLVAPPGAVNANATTGGVMLTWPASADSVLGYHVYRSASPDGPFARLTSLLVTDSSFTDTTASPSTYTYMVRAVALQTTPSGSFFNASQGIFVTVDAAGVALPMQLSAVQTANGLVLSWNSQVGTSYRVLAETNLTQGNWQAVSDQITATATTTSWTDADLSSRPQRFYRVVSP